MRTKKYNLEKFRILLTTVTYWENKFAIIKISTVLGHLHDFMNFFPNEEFSPHGESNPRVFACRTNLLLYLSPYLSLANN